jgi:ERCC4-type nuclease
MTEKYLLIKNCKNMLAQTSDVERILNYLKSNGCSKTQSIVMLKSIKDISLDESKQIVHFSQTWQDRFNDDEKFHASIEEILTKD